MQTLPRFFAAKDDSGASPAIICSLCPRRCTIKAGDFGACGVRGNKNGKGLIPFYGLVTALALDPIEKKPLYHFRPGSSIFSVGFSGCNLRCPFCQNWNISQNPGARGRSMSPAEIISAVLRESRDEKPAIAYTYSEPLVHAEFLLDCMSLARRHGIANVLVTNGCVNAEAATEILALTDAANIDLKCFSAQTYSKILGGNLDTVLEFIALAIKAGVHVEITTLAVPELNDSGDEMDAAAGFIAGLRDQTENGAAEIPWHLSAYHPDYRWNAPPTDPAFLLETARRARKLLPYVYTGNIAGEINNTQCRFCGETLVRREGYSVDISGLAPPAEGEKRCRCSRCKEVSPVVC